MSQSTQSKKTEKIRVFIKMPQNQWNKSFEMSIYLNKIKTVGDLRKKLANRLCEGESTIILSFKDELLLENEKPFESLKVRQGNTIFVCVKSFKINEFPKRFEMGGLEFLGEPALEKLRLHEQEKWRNELLQQQRLSEQKPQGIYSQMKYEIEHLMEMGFDREIAAQTLKQVGGNVMLAIEKLADY